METFNILVHVGEANFAFPQTLYESGCHQCWVLRGSDTSSCPRVWLESVGVLCQALEARKIESGTFLNKRHYRESDGYLLITMMYLKASLLCRQIVTQLLHCRGDLLKFLLYSLKLLPCLAEILACPSVLLLYSFQLLLCPGVLLLYSLKLLLCLVEFSACPGVRLLCSFQLLPCLIEFSMCPGVCLLCSFQLLLCLVEFSVCPGVCLLCSFQLLLGPFQPCNLLLWLMQVLWSRQ